MPGLGQRQAALAVMLTAAAAPGVPAASRAVGLAFTGVLMTAGVKLCCLVGGPCILYIPLRSPADEQACTQFRPGGTKLH